jgi:hypothetical protein
MPAVITRRTCESCGKPHNLCHPVVGALVPGAEYEYDCPGTNETVPFTVGDRPDKVSPSIPADSILIRHADY